MTGILKTKTFVSVPYRQVSIAYHIFHIEFDNANGNEKNFGCVLQINHSARQALSHYLF